MSLSRFETPDVSASSEQKFSDTKIEASVSSVDELPLAPGGPRSHFFKPSSDKASSAAPESTLHFRVVP